jgi:hypothetical protein
MVPPATRKKVIHGDDLLYRFFQDALEGEPQLYAGVPRLLVTTMGIWLPLGVYERWPVLLPWVVRDPKCRRDPNAGGADVWSSPDADGYLRDDNSLIKSLPRALTVKGPKGSRVRGARMGTEFVACHIWRVVPDERLASRIPLLNSFVPNLVWLPSQVAKLSDIEGGLVQRMLQAMSCAVYRHAPVAPHLRGLVEEAWAMIPPPESPDIGSVDLTGLNWFEATDGFYRTRLTRLGSVLQALEAIELGLPVAERVVSRRYAEGLPRVEPAARTELKDLLKRFETP